MDLTGFNANEVEVRQSTDLLPEGDYKIAFIQGVETQTKAGTGSYLALTAEILEGEHQGRKLWERLNLKNQNDVARKIAEVTLGEICRAIGIVTPTHSDELLNKPMIARVIVKAPTDRDKAAGYDRPRNEIKAYEAATNGASHADAKAGAAPTASTPPWKR